MIGAKSIRDLAFTLVAILPIGMPGISRGQDGGEFAFNPELVSLLDGMQGASCKPSSITFEDQFYNITCADGRAFTYQTILPSSEDDPSQLNTILAISAQRDDQWKNNINQHNENDFAKQCLNPPSQIDPDRIPGGVCVGVGSMLYNGAIALARRGDDNQLYNIRLATSFNLRGCVQGAPKGCIKVAQDLSFNRLVKMERWLLINLCNYSGCWDQLSTSYQTEDPKDLGAATEAAAKACNTLHGIGIDAINPDWVEDSCENATKLGANVNVAAVTRRVQMEYDERKQADADRNAMFAERNAELASEMSQRQALVASLTGGGNLIGQTAAQQSAAIRSIGNSAAAARFNSHPTAPSQIPLGNGQPQLAYAPPPPIPARTGDTNSGSSPGYSANNGAPPAAAPSSNNGCPPGTSGCISPLPNSCISTFYDSSNNNWASFRNDCNQPLWLQWVAYNNSINGAGGVSVGGSTSTFQSSDQMRIIGGFSIYICPFDYMAVDSAGVPIGRPNAPYMCIPRAH